MGDLGNFLGISARLFWLFSFRRHQFDKDGVLGPAAVHHHSSNTTWLLMKKLGDLIPTKAGDLAKTTDLGKTLGDWKHKKKAKQSSQPKSNRKFTYQALRALSTLVRNIRDFHWTDWSGHASKEHVFQLDAVSCMVWVEIVAMKRLRYLIEYPGW